MSVERANIATATKQKARRTQTRDRILRVSWRASRGMKEYECIDGRVSVASWLTVCVCVCVGASEEERRAGPWLSGATRVSGQRGLLTG